MTYDMDDLQTAAKLFKVLVHPARLEILEVLRDGEQCVCHLEAVLGYRQAYISQHLMVLREADLVQDRRDGWNIFYHVIEPRIYAVIDAARLVNDDERASRPSLPLESAACPCPKCSPELKVVPV